MERYLVGGLNDSAFGGRALGRGEVGLAVESVDQELGFARPRFIGDDTNIADGPEDFHDLQRKASIFDKLVVLPVQRMYIFGCGIES